MGEDFNREKEHETSRDKEIEDEGSIFDRVRADGLKGRLESLLRDGKLRNLVGELRMPREIITHILAQVDETKHAALGVVSREVRLFLERTNLADELAKLLTQISFEVSTQVRFVPSDKAIRRKDKKKRANAEESPQGTEGGKETSDLSEDS